MKTLSKKYRIFFTSAIIIILILLAVLIGILAAPHTPTITTETIDEASGETLYEINQEQNEGNEISLIGFKVFYEFGFSKNQQDIITNTIKEFFTTNYPDFSSIHYLKDSFYYDPKTESNFVLLSNTNQKFLVHLNTLGTINNIEVIITPEH